MLENVFLAVYSPNRVSELVVTVFALTVPRYPLLFLSTSKKKVSIFLLKTIISGPVCITVQLLKLQISRDSSELQTQKDH